MKQEKKVAAPVEEIVVKSNVPTTVYSSPGSTTVVVKDRKGNTRDVDEYNRRYDSRDNDFVMENDTLYINEKEDDGLDGEWVNGEFEGSQDDYEYATRIIRFRNPRYAISISSPLYWDVVYGLNSWDWNVYTDGLYAYAFPTFTNRLWWDWRYNSYGWGGYPYYGWGWNSWYGPSWSFGWGGWYGGGWWGHHHHHHYHPGYYPGGGGHWGGGHWGNAYTNRRSYGPSRSSTVNGGQTVRRSSTTSGQVRRSSTGTSTRRVVGTRSSSTVRSSSSATRSSVNRSSAASTRRSTYTRPSSTRSSSYNSSVEGVRSSRSSGVRSSVGTSTRSRTSSTYNRGSSAAPARSYSNDNNRSSNRSYSAPVRSSSSTRSSSSFSSGSSSRSSYSSGGGGGASRSSGGGGSRRR